MVVIIAWAKFFAPKAPPASQQPNKPAASAPANPGLYQASSGGRDAPATLTAPAELDFAWSDGHLEVTKHFKFTDTYVVQTEVTAKLDGKPINAGLSWMGGFGDTTVQNPIPVET